MTDDGTLPDRLRNMVRNPNAIGTHSAAGRTRIGVGMLFEVLRWHSQRATTGDPFRLNNSYRSRYARLLIERRPEWAHLFELRRLADDPTTTTTATTTRSNP